MRSAATIVAAFIALLTVCAPASAETGSERELICLTNGARSTAGVAALRVSDDLTRVARDHSARMARSGTLHHNQDLASDVSSWTVLAENVGVGPSASRVHDALMNSSGHRRNILDDRVRQIGVGVAVSADGRLWVTQVFRAPSRSLASASVSCSTGASAPTLSVVGDWNGDGRQTPGRFTGGRWELSNDLTGKVHQVVDYGRNGDIPVVGDWNGDGRDTPAVVRGTTWYLTSKLGGGTTWKFAYGRVTRGDVPIAGDWNGDGRDTVGIIRDGEWHLRHRLSGGAGQVVFTFGRLTRGDRALVGDWNGDGRDTVGIVRDGEWHLRHSLSGGPGQTVFTYGRVTRGDTPITGDWDRDGRTGVGIVRGNEWHLRSSLSGGPAQQIVRW